MKLNKRKCENCKERFQKTRPLQFVCSPKCGIEHERKKQAKKQKKETRQRKEALKTKKDWTKEVQVEFNKFIRLRDHDQPCISCGGFPTSSPLTGGVWDCGHYRSVGSTPELRFEEKNAYRQCKKCNRELSGNAVEYRKRLIERVGIEVVEWVEGPHEQKNWTIEDLKELKAHYKKLNRDLTNNSN